MIGGGARSGELTLPGFVHDLCSAAHPMGASSPAFAQFPLKQFGLEWIHPSAPLAHPLDDGTAVLLEREVRATAAQLGVDSGTYRRLVEPLARAWPNLARDILRPLGLPSTPVAFARFGAVALGPASIVARTLFRSERARALFAGIAAHSVLPLEWMASSAIGWALALAGHAVGWPVAGGGSQSITNALAGYLQSLGGKVVHGCRVRSLDELPVDSLRLLDITPRQFLVVAGSRVPNGYKRRLDRYRYGPGVFKIDWALREPIPWKARECARAGTVHLAGTLKDIADCERAVWRGLHPERPFVLLTQPTLFDPSRAPSGRHTAWAYCHVPNGSTVDMGAAIEAQIERFAPGFGDCVLARSTANTAQIETRNANLIGGDISGGATTFSQMFLRPTASLYRTPLAGVYLCSSSTPPGGGVHGMCGYHAARMALRDAGLEGD
jgi:phytoene dehydrogenase-like protein